MGGGAAKIEKKGLRASRTYYYCDEIESSILNLIA